MADVVTFFGKIFTPKLIIKKRQFFLYKLIFWKIWIESSPGLSIVILMKNNDEKLNKYEFVDELPIYGCIFYFKEKYI